MFPLTNKEPYIKPSGERTTLGYMFAAAGGDISELEHEVDLLQEASTEHGSQIQALTNYVANTGVKNALPFDLATIKALNTGGTWSGNTYTGNGVTFTVNDDGTYTVTTSEAPTNTAILYLGDYSSKGMVLNGCPSGGSDTTYKLQAFASGASVNDYGNGATINDDTTRNFRIVIYTGAGVINKTFKPMIRDASIADDSYQPYAMTNRELTDAKIDASQIAPIENGATASTSYAQGAYFIHNGKFCKAKTSISSGATFTKGTNYEETTLAAELIALAQ